MADASSSPFARPVRVETLRPRPSELVVAPDDAERAGIVAAFGLASLASLEGRYRLAREGERVTLEGTVSARLEQICVVSLEPLPVELDVDVRLVFEPAEPEETARKPDLAEIDLDYAGEDPPEPIVGGVIDLGAVTLEHLALSLEPYPRRPDADWAEPPQAAAETSPFAALARLKRES